MSLLELREIQKSYRRGGFFGRHYRFQVLKDVSLTLDPGKCLGLLGRSGAGKSTLGRIALGLEPPDSGEVLFKGKSLRSMNRKQSHRTRRNLQVIFQNSLGSVNPRLTAARIIAEPVQNFEDINGKELRKRVCYLLERVGLRETDADKHPHQFSGGELQRVCIARAISLMPQVIVLDEAVSSLDMVIQATILDLLSELQRELGTAYLFISHDIRVLLRMADSLAVMHDGRIVEFSRDLEGLGRMKHPAFLELLKAILPPLPPASCARATAHD